MNTQLPDPLEAARRQRVRQVHFVGIGGAGMSGIAEVTLTLGYQVSGSDLKASDATRRLAELGATIHLGHDPAHLGDASVVVVSSAVDQSNPEVAVALEKQVPVIPRAEMLAELMRFRYGIAVAGTHGKTTTTSLIASLLAEGGLDPTFVIGGRLISAGAHARLGAGPYMVAEADESDASFLHLTPMLSVVTNIDADHLATYGGDFQRLRETFIEFLHRMPFYGLAVVCIDDHEIAALLPDIARPLRTYGFDESADVRATDLAQDGSLTCFNVQLPDGTSFAARFTLPGKHNAQNALAAIAIALELNVDVAAIQAGLESFAGIGRRFQDYGALSVDGKKATLIDDYGHHPREVAATIDAVRARWPERRLLLVFQPHRYSRTRDLFDDFCEALSATDALLLCDVFPAGEDVIPGADGRALARAIRTRGQVDPVFVGALDELPELLASVVQDGDIVVTSGAGSIGAAAAQLAEQYAGVLA